MVDLVERVYHIDRAICYRSGDIAGIMRREIAYKAQIRIPAFICGSERVRVDVRDCQR